MSRFNQFSLERSKYFDGYVLRRGAAGLGSFTCVDGGFLVAGKRKPVATLEEAVRQVLAREIQVRRDEIAWLQAVDYEIETAQKNGNPKPKEDRLLDLCDLP